MSSHHDDNDDDGDDADDDDGNRDHRFSLGETIYVYYYQFVKYKYIRFIRW